MFALRVGVKAGVKVIGRRKYSRSTKITEYLRDLSLNTRDPLWRLVMALHSPRRLSLSSALDASHVSLDDFAHWRASIYASNIDKALENNPSSTPPSWLVLYLAAFRVRTSRHASGSLLDLSFDHIKVAPPTVQAPLLVMTMIHLARFDIVLPMQRVIDAFLVVSISHESQNMHFNHLLAAMTSTRQRSRQTGRNAVTVLRTMEARQLRLSPRTCSALLADRYTTHGLTEVLRRRQMHLGVVPTASHFESYLRVYATDGAIHDAHRYAKAIRDLRRPYYDGRGTEEDAADQAELVARSDTLLVRSQPDSASAFEFLVRLAEKSHKVEKSDRLRHLAPRRPNTHPRAVYGKRAVDSYDWASAFAVTVRDLTIPSYALHDLFMRARPVSSEMRHTVATHTMLIRGFLLRHAWELAYHAWTRLVRSGLHIDEMALAAGIQALVLSSRPEQAFSTLEMHTARSRAELSTQYRHLRPLRATTALINLFMNSLHRILRPDLIFRLWDAMEELYDVRPSAETLRIVLEAAQFPHILDDSFAGQFALLALKNPFRNPPPPPATRMALVHSLTSQAATAYRSGVWRDKVATETASRIFLQAVFNAPERLALATLEPPAYAVRAYTESDSAAPTIRLSMAPQRFELPQDVLAPGGRAHFPGIVLRERDWAAYIMLLGMTRRAPEIARVLVWMRGLGMRPSKRTLGVALAFWGEVSVQPPVIAAMAGREGDQYLRLVQWLREWCGDLVDERAVGLWRARITRVKMQRRQTVHSGRLVDEESIWAMRDINA
ncbi:hypothetical protein B0H16DRAFT_1689985 [Mycena metata]|uniref:Uncharacterized protein n=1 Tax=Mycena metata TaxID=1033252 RepID=A0AAD7J3J3_9AGAR|nr:hypothetical protein B0H16DRAFT_1689985 [Mycena metata]